MAGSKNVAILINPARPYRCDIVKGIVKYSQQIAHWKFFIDPFGAAAPDKRMRYWDCDGIILHSWVKQVVDYLKVTRIPTILVSSAMANPGLPQIVPDNYAIGRLAAEHLLQKGFRNFAYWSGSGKSNNSSILRAKGFTDRLANPGEYAQRNKNDKNKQSGSFLCHSLALETDMELSGDEWDSQHASLKQWVAALPKPISIFVNNDVNCRRLAVACQSCGLRVPEDVALIGVDNEELICEFSDPPLSSVDPAWGAVGYEAAALLDRMMAGAEAPASTILIAPRGLVCRQSTNTMVVDDPLVAKAIEFIRNRTGQTVRISEVLKHVGVSRRSLEQRFKASIGRGPVSEIRRNRVEHAKKLLAETHDSIAVIARAAGFSNAQSLCVIFRREVGLPPTTFRKQARDSGK